MAGRVILSNKIKGIFKVASSNIFSFVASMLVSFVLPLMISVEQYGYWQLFILYSSYAGFFAFGFNDGVHLNYATCNYDSELHSRFKSFTYILLFLTGIETLLIILSIYIGGDFTITKDKYIYIFSALNIPPTILNGLFLYMNQATLRFKQYAAANIFDKVIFVFVLIVLFILKEQSSYTFMLAFTLCRYSVIYYNYKSSKEVFKVTPLRFQSIKSEVCNNFKSGLPLMIALILGGPTLIVGSRFLVKINFGIDAFSSYSFSIHTLVVAGQFIGAIATVFYPLLKRAENFQLKRMYSSFDKISTLFSLVLLLTYYPALLVVKTVYVNYCSILDYLYLIYPLFIFECKSKVLIVNMYKVNGIPQKLIIVNILGIVLHLLCVLSAYYIWGSIYSIAGATLISYAIWYYIVQIHIYKKYKWDVGLSIFQDSINVIVFIFINVITNIYIDGFYRAMIASCLIFIGFIVLLYFVKHKYVSNVLCEFKALMD